MLPCDFVPFLGTKYICDFRKIAEKYFVPKKGRNHKGANMKPPRPSKHRGRNHQHASTSHDVCINYRVQRGSLIPRRLHSGGDWIWRWIGFLRVFISKNIIDQPSILRDRTRDTRKIGECCGQQKSSILRNSSVLLSFHTIEYFVPF